MNLDQHRELWRIRFERILQLEQESLEFYKKLLKEKDAVLEEAGIKSLLKEIAADEGHHVHIAKDLLRVIGPRSEKSK